MKKILFVLIVICVSFLTGCRENKVLIAENPITESELISKIEKDIYDETGDSVTVTIDKISNLKIVFGMVSFQSSYYVQNGYTYYFTITNNDNNNIKATGFYEDGYTEVLPDGRKVSEPPETQNQYVKERARYYINQRASIIAKRLLTDYKYYYDDRYNVIYIITYLPDYESTSRFFNSIEDVFEGNEYVDVTLYVFKEKDRYDKIDIDENIEYAKKGGLVFLSKEGLFIVYKEKFEINDLKEFSKEVYENIECTDYLDDYVVYEYEYNKYSKNESIKGITTTRHDY